MNTFSPAFCNRLSRFSIVLALLFTLSPFAAHAAPLILRSADVHPEDFPTVQAVLHMHQVLQDKTQGRIGIQVFHSSQLGDEGMLATQVVAGQLDLNRLSSQTLTHIAPEFNVLALPYLFRDESHLRKVLDGEIGKDLLKGLEAHGLIGLAFYEGGVRNIYTRERAGATLASIQGLKLRISSSPISRRTLESLGASTVEIPYAHIGRALSNQLVDGAENNLNAYNSAGHAQYAPFFTASAHSMPPEVLIMSAKSWKKLSAEDQALVRKAALESVGIMRGMWDQRIERATAVLRLKGVEFVELGPQEREKFVAATASLRNEAMRDAATRRLIERIKAIK